MQARVGMQEVLMQTDSCLPCKEFSDHNGECTCGCIRNSITCTRSQTLLRYLYPAGSLEGKGSSGITAFSKNSL